MGELSVTFVEQMFAGGCVTVGDKTSVLPYLQVDFDEFQMSDPTSRAIVRAAKLAATEAWGNMIPTPENLVTVILKEGLGSTEPKTLEEVAEFRARAIGRMLELREVGADSAAAINSLGSAIQEYIQARKLAAWSQEAGKTTHDSSKSAIDMYYELSASLEQVRPGAVDAKLYRLSDFKAAIRNFTQQQTALLGKKLMTFPPQFWMHNHIPFLMPGLVYVVSGQTGVGKSSILHQIADWLSQCGFRVLYFHPEDTIERQAMRVARRMTGASPSELMAGDPRGKFKQVSTTVTERNKNSGGEVIWCHCINQPTSYIRMIANSVNADVIILDYIQKVNLAPQLKIANGIENVALGMVTEEIKQIAEDHKHQCAFIIGSQEAEREYGSAVRKGTAGSRKIQWKSQFVVEFERDILTEKDEPEVVDGIMIAGPGDLSGFGGLNIAKNNDGPTGKIPGIFHGMRQEFMALEYKAWQRNHPGQMYPMSVLRAPDEKYLKDWDDKSRAWDKLDMVMKPPKIRRRATKEKTDSATWERKNVDDVPPDEDDGVPF